MRIIVVPIYFLEHKSKSLDLTQGMKIESMNDIFFEDVFPCKDTRETSSNKRTHETTSVPTQSENEPKLSKRAKIVKFFWTRLSNLYVGK